MVGITSYGAYVPAYRLSRELIAKAWSSGSQGGEKAVANWDEDTITMASEAIFDCLTGTSAQEVDGLLFASTSSAFKEKLASSLLAAIADMRKEITTQDVGDTLRAATTALRSAVDAVKSGSAKKVVVAAAEARLGAPQTDMEQTLGDGAAALMIGDTDVIATVEGSHSVSEEFSDYWRKDNDNFVRSFEEKWGATYGYLNTVSSAVSTILRKYELRPKDFAKAVIYAPDARNYASLMKTLGFDPKTQVQDPLLTTVGNTGAAQPLMMLVNALETAKPGDQILLVGYGNGADAFILKVTDNIEKARNRRGIKGYLEKKRPMPTYEKYLRFRGLVEEEKPTIAMGSSPITIWRDRQSVISLYANKCRKCGTVSFPIQRVCVSCRTKDDFDRIPLSKTGTVFTMTRDNLATSPDGMLPIGVLEMDSGGRFYCQFTDVDPFDVNIGDRMEVIYRKVNDRSGLHNYFWKARPIK